MTLQTALVIPDRELWSWRSPSWPRPTTEGDIGVLTGHSPVFGILAEASVAEIIGDEGTVRAAVSGGFFSVADDQVSILAAQAQLGGEVDVEQVRQEIAAALAEAMPGADDSPAVRYAKARLRAAGSQG